MLAKRKETTKEESMAIHLDFDWVHQVIRVIGATKIDVQSLYDAIRETEAGVDKGSYDHIVDGEGKTDLGGGERTPITAELRGNWRLEFVNQSHDDDVTPPAPCVYRVVGGIVVGTGGRFPFLEAPDQYVENVVHPKEKFGVLGSSKQLARDLDLWGAKCDANGLPVSVVYFDIDHFKRLNTEHTETVVDTHVLGPYHEFVAAFVGTKATAYAEGGDEFVLLLPGKSLDEALEVAERLREETEAEEFVVKGKQERFTISLGVAERQPGEALSSVKQRANQAKADAKNAGRNTVKAAQ